MGAFLEASLVGLFVFVGCLFLYVVGGWACLVWCFWWFGWISCETVLVGFL